MEETPAVYSHNPYQEDGFPLLVLDVNRRHCVPFSEGFRVLHWHDEIQLVYLLEGEIYARVYGEMIQASQGDCLFLNRGVLHHITEKKNCRYHSYLIPPKMLGFFSGSVMEQEDVERILNQPQLIHRLFSAKDGQCSAFLEQMQQLDRLYFSQEKPDHTEYRLSVALVQVWLELLCLLPQEELHPVKADPRHERIRRMLSFLHTHYAEAISLEQIAQEAHVSRSECIRCFHRCLGEAPYAYLKRYRLHCSLSLLQGSHLSVTEIAMQVGFRCTSSYISYFRQEYGQTPKRYREFWAEQSKKDKVLPLESETTITEKRK